jgi:hypothetical protein
MKSSGKKNNFIILGFLFLALINADAKEEAAPNQSFLFSGLSPLAFDTL